MNTADKLNQIVAKNFTYVSVSYIDANAELHFDHFVVLTPSKPVARQAAEAIVAQRIGQAVLPPRSKLNYGVANSGATVSLYPRNYVREAKTMAQETPERVYAVESTTTIQVSA